MTQILSDSFKSSQGQIADMYTHAVCGAREETVPYQPRHLLHFCPCWWSESDIDYQMLLISRNPKCHPGSKEI